MAYGWQCFAFHLFVATTVYAHPQCSASSRQTTMNIFDNILPVLRVAQAAAAGNPVPGLGGAITGVVALAEMISTTKANMDDLPDLIKMLKPLAEIETVGYSDNLKQRVDTLKENLEPKTTRLRSLAKKVKCKQFWKRKKYEKEIQEIRAFIASCLQDFTFHNNISIKILVDQMSTTVDQVDTAVQRMEPQGDQQGPGQGHGEQGQTSKSQTVINYNYGGTGGAGGPGGTGGAGGSW
ncbi:hypothetical protein B0H14DRAFT_830599 [Mycena olivaceomarginata]|nr:hypothetical protein B0H14DRAFT_830599 [Mycena olivaceomarginata]